MRDWAPPTGPRIRRKSRCFHIRTTMTVRLHLQYLTCLEGIEWPCAGVPGIVFEGVGVTGTRHGWGVRLSKFEIFEISAGSGPRGRHPVTH